ncbi:3-keto-disaccharide hydrolase [Poritiphilus flavus]|uniref:DUF1080 domain-containing protein n=1 Tax=Poritiphilus flavus TaxID=2697053 RepID=A0A6L9EAX4_9FLAO|nr:DUF1080 domain-containing protein [Poritiphilus flavus]NAS11905.1 DUF1080 domain-containing protein [Poritiphilus flavus]
MNGKLIFFGLALILLGCKEQQKDKVSPDPEEKEPQWISLMDASQWRGYNMDSLPEKWVVKDSLITCFGDAEAEGGDIISKETYDNFELSLEWKISEAGNSGIFYHVVEDTLYGSAASTGPEYQILDDVGFPEPIEDWQKTGANYAMHTANAKKKLKAVGEWNSSRIIFDRGKVEHWLNGEKIVEFDKNSADWDERREAGKWKDYPAYGKTNDGHFALQDHGAGVWFRKIKVRRL